MSKRVPRAAVQAPRSPRAPAASALQTLAKSVRAGSVVVAEEVSALGLPPPERVHRLRVALRRLLALLELASSVGAAPPDKAVRRLRELLRVLSPLRDLHVQLETVEELSTRDPRAVSVASALRSREELFARRAEKAIRRFRAHTHEADVEAIVAVLAGSRSAAEDSALKAVLMGIAAKRYIAFERLRQRIDPADAEALHRMRVALKKYRYAVEALAPIVGGSTEVTLKTMKRFQDALGALHDADVLDKTIRATAKSLEPAGRRELLSLRRELVVRHEEELAAFTAQLASRAPSWTF